MTKIVKEERLKKGLFPCLVIAIVIAIAILILSQMFGMSPVSGLSRDYRGESGAVGTYQIGGSGSILQPSDPDSAQVPGNKHPVGKLSRWCLQTV